MANPQDNSQVLANVREVLRSEGIEVETQQQGGLLSSQILPAMASTRDIQTAFYSFAPSTTQTGFKATVLVKLKNVIINVLDRMVTRQQKYNELTYQAIADLQAQIDELKSHGK